MPTATLTLLFLILGACAGGDAASTEPDRTPALDAAAPTDRPAPSTIAPRQFGEPRPSQDSGQREPPAAGTRRPATNAAPGRGSGAAARSVRQPTAERNPSAKPARIVIPAIAVDARVVPVGLEPDQSMETPPFGLAGWYREGPRPGQRGPAVIVAHVDSHRGPDVFFRLRKLTPGDEVQVHRQDGSVAAFVVERSEQAPKDSLPTERIWNATDQPVLRLITCGGDFDRSRRSYRDNVVVYAAPR